MSSSVKSIAVVAALGLAFAAKASEPRHKLQARSASAQPDRPDREIRPPAEPLGYVKYGLGGEYTVTNDLVVLPGLSPSATYDEGTILKADCWIAVRRSGGDSRSAITFGLLGNGTLFGAEMSNDGGDVTQVPELGKGLTVTGPDRNSTRVYHLTVDAMTASKGSIVLAVSKRNSDLYAVLPTSRCQWSSR